MSLLGSRLKELRKSLNMSMSELGLRIGVAKSTIAGYEKGFREPAIDKINLLAKHLGVSTDYLLGMSNQILLEHNDIRSQLPQQFNAKTFFTSKELHWDGVPLNEADLELIKMILERTASAKKEVLK